MLRTPALRELAITGFVYAALQVCLMSFLVVYLTETLGFSLVAAGFALTAANLGGIVGRILWGAVADLYVAPRELLGLIGVAAGACAWLTAPFGVGWPSAALLAVCVLFRRDRDRLERRAALRGGPPRAVRPGRSDHRRRRIS